MTIQQLKAKFEAADRHLTQGSFKSRDEKRRATEEMVAAMTAYHAAKR
jgi:hypothetical protein